MGFCSHSTEKIANDKTEIDNIFFTDYLPGAPDMAVKVYLLGLFLCEHDDQSNTLPGIAKVLDITEQTVLECFYYWQEVGIVQVLESIPQQIKFMPMKNSLFANKKFSKTKYASFNGEMQELFDRMLTPNEFVEYYTLIESYHLEKDALVRIAKFCTQKKGRNVGCGYICTVAKNWISEGVFTTADVDERINMLEMQTQDMKSLLSALKISRLATLEEFEYYIKWTEKLGFLPQVLVFVAKHFKKTKRKCDFAFLDSKLCNYYSMGICSTQEIQEYENSLSQKFEIAREVCKRLGLFYENLQPVVETYVNKWHNMGYEKDVICAVASYCFRAQIKSLDGLDQTISKLFSKGIVSQAALDEYLAELEKVDARAKHILNLLGLERRVTAFDRELVSTWSEKWNMPNDVVEYAASVCCGRFQPMQAINKLLSKWKELGVCDVEGAKANTPDFAIKPAKETKKQKIEKHEFDRQELNALFDSLDEIEV